MVALLIAVMLACLVVVASLSEVVGSKDWLTTVAPAWLQAFGAIGTFVIALKAYREWWHADLARNAAIQAKDLMPQVNELILCVGRIRRERQTISSELSSRVLASVCKVRSAAYRACGDAVHEMHRVMATVVDDELFDEVDGLIDMAHDVMAAYSHVEAMSAIEFDSFDAQDSKILWDCLSKLGCGTQEVFSFPDDFDQNLISKRQRLHKVLRAKMAFRS